MPHGRSSGSTTSAFVCGLAYLLASFAVAIPHPASAQPGEASVFVGQAIIAYEEKRYEDAQVALRGALLSDPSNVDALYYTGLVSIALGRLGQATEALEKARSLDPRDHAISFQLGALYFGMEKYDQAQPLLEGVFAEKPRTDSLGYYVGFMRYRTKDYQGALRAFRAGTSSDPNVQQLTRFYSGLALGVLGLPEQAAEMGEALKLQPASPLTGPAERLLSTVAAAREAERRLRAEVKIGFFHDDNVPVLPSINADPAVKSLTQGKQKSSLGELGALRLDYSFLRNGPWEATATASVFGTYNNDLPDFNILDLMGGFGGTYRNTAYGIPYQVGLQYMYDYLMLDRNEFVQRHTVVPSGAAVWNSWNLTAVQLRYQDKYFANQSSLPPQQNRSGSNYMGGFIHLFRFAGDKHLIKVGYQFDFDDTQGTDFLYLGNRALAGAQYTLPWLAIRLNLDFDVHLRDYRHRNAVFPISDPGTVKQFDTEYNFIAGATLPLPYSLSLSATYQATRNRSNIDIYTYDRNVGSLILTWTY